MDPDGSLPHSQVPANCPSPELLCEQFMYLWWGAVNTLPNPQAGGPTLVGCPVTAYSIYSQLPSILQAVPLSST